MKRILISLICLFWAYFVNAQVPQGYPSPSSTGYAKWGYVKTDSAGISALRDTNWIPKYVGSWVYWQNPASDSSFWVFNNRATGKKWDKVVMISQGNITGYMKYTDTASMLAGYLRQTTIGVTVQGYNAATTILGNTTLGSGSILLGSGFIGTGSVVLASGSTGTGGNVVYSGSPALTTPSIAAITVSGGIATLPTGSSGTLAYRSDTGRVATVLATGGSLNKVRDSLVNLISAGGFGTVLSVATTNGAGIISSVANATTSPNITMRVDTNRTVSAIVTGGSLNKVRDSIMSVLTAADLLKVNISDTAAMMSGYRRNSVNITNANLVNSTISGTALGGTLPNLNFGTYLQAGATSYNGSTAVTMTTNATSSNLGTTLVARDANGDFSSRNITATLLGLASESTLATITNDVTSNITVYPTWVTSNTGYLGLNVSSTKISFNPSTGILTSTGFTGNLTGNATTASTLQTPRTINGVSFDGSANIAISASVLNAISAGYGLTGSNYDGSLARTWTADTTKVIPYTDTLAIWGISSKAFVRNFLSLTTTGTSGAATFSSNTGIFNIPQYQAAYSELSVIGALVSVGVLQRTGTNTLSYTTTPTLTGTNFSGIPNVALTNSAITIQGASTSLGGSVNIINGTGFVKASGTTISYDNSTYLTTTTAGTTYVPYTGATGAVNLGTNTLASGAITSSGTVTAPSTNISTSGTFGGSQTTLPLTLLGRLSDNLVGIYFKNNANSTEQAEVQVNSSGDYLFYSGSSPALKAILANGTGALTLGSTAGTGTGALYSGAITSANINITAGGADYPNGQLEFTNTTTGGYVGIGSQLAGAGIIYFDHRATGNTGNFVFRNGTGGANTMVTIGNGGTINSGAITSSGNVTLNGAAGDRILEVMTNTSGNPRLYLTASGSDGSQIYHDRTNDRLTFGVSSYTDVLHFSAASGGAAIFSSSVTANYFASIVGLSTPNIKGTVGASITISAGAGAGTTPGVSVTGTDLAGKISITTGTTPSASAVLATLTFGASPASNTYIVLTPANAATAALASGATIYVTTSTTTFILNTNTTALTASTVYAWYYHVII